MITTFLRDFGLQRAVTHVVLAALTALGLYAVTLYTPGAGIVYVGTIGFGYLCVIFLCATLLIGPLNLLRKRLNPVNIDLRRDVGIWSAITGCLHVVFAVIRDYRGSILAFLVPGGRSLLNTGVLSNDFGVVATILLIVLLVLSNQLSLRKLKGKRWKQIQRLNYVLVTFAILHTLIYQRLSGRQRYFVDATVLTVLVVLALQVIGITVYQRRKMAQLRR